MSIITSLKKIWKINREVCQYMTFSRMPFFKIAKEYLQNCERILDIGAGGGEFIQFMNRGDIYAIDRNRDTVSKLQRQGINAICATLPEIPFPDNYFDGIHLSHVLEHLYPEEFYDTLKEVDRVLKTDGILVISSPLLWEGFYADLSHIKPYDPKVYVNYLTKTDGQSHTRATIGSYEILQLTYRYNIGEINPIIWRNFVLFNTILFLAVKFLRKIGIGYLQKTGYTIVLKKLK